MATKKKGTDVTTKGAKQAERAKELFDRAVEMRQAGDIEGSDRALEQANDLWAKAITALGRT